MAEDWSRPPGEGKYAQIEREQRWLCASVPAAAQFVAEIEDWYLADSTLRLRKMALADKTVLKLTQKVRATPHDPSVVKITNIYLTGQEFELLRQLPGRDLRKRRFELNQDGYRYVIDDVETGEEQRLVLAEIELPGNEINWLPLPAFAVLDVTHDDRYSAGTLAKKVGLGRQMEE